MSAKQPTDQDRLRANIHLYKILAARAEITNAEIELLRLSKDTGLHIDLENCCVTN